MNDRWTTDHVLSLSPDVPSTKAAARLAKAEPWSGTGTSADAVWGACKGSGSRPYQTVVALDGPAYHCSCPSRKFPCKHALALLLLWAGNALAGEEAPAWATTWLTSRQQRAERATERAADRTTGRADASAPRDEAAAAARRAGREARVAVGAAELQARLTDQLSTGLAEAPSQGYGFWEGVAARMVDAQAPGLATRARELGALPASGQDWPSRLLEEYGLLHLLAAGYQRVGELPEPLAATVRSRVGFTVDAAEVLRGPLVRDRWLVLGSRDSADDRLTTRRLWLRGEESGRTALLLSFGRPGVAPELALPTGLALDAELAFHPAARPLRAALGTRHAGPAAAPRPSGVTIDAALDTYAAALGDDPWLTSWPVVVSDVVPVPTETGWSLVDGTGSIPLRSGSFWRLVAASQGRPVTLFGECGCRGFDAVTAWTNEGSLLL
ncbi:SWIM zinc finger family protein [Streptacidiphilus fuscans]|uniref:SWIM zinc finger family protein n=1 Tax=Streptacidiphilus fuscans TaxID=2789292 RepID=A0A931B247_9ACTN|nr:SWIM zinc finger family protein [Streptacidiphilus fuscans]MBF9067837.1 SWIM zinc finger family protein [Streptacidiphilus fuscans]